MYRDLDGHIKPQNSALLVILGFQRIHEYTCPLSVGVIIILFTSDHLHITLYFIICEYTLSTGPIITKKSIHTF
jgi:hypothetical protein